MKKTLQFILILFTTSLIGSGSAHALADNPGTESSLSSVMEESSAHRIYFKDLRTWRMGADQAPSDLMQYNGETVEIVGYMIPFDSIERIDRFILLQAPFMGCFHVPPPQPNETLMINSDQVMPDYIYEPIRIVGKLTIEETYVDRFLVSKYTIDAVRIEAVQMDEAELEDLPANFHMYSEF